MTLANGLNGVGQRRAYGSEGQFCIVEEETGEQKKGDAGDTTEADRVGEDGEASGGMSRVQRPNVRSAR